jgi:dihydroxy-acid dehydratase
MGEASTAGTSPAPIPESVREFFKAAPGGVPTQVAFSQTRAGRPRHRPRERLSSATVAHAYSKDGGLAVLYGNIASTAAS